MSDTALPHYEIKARLSDGLRVTVSNGRHEWYADEPIAKGGEESAPNPYELLLGSLAACTAVTLKLYTTQKGIPLEWVETTYEFDRVHADDCAECEQEGTGLIERIKSHVTIGGTFDDAQRNRLAQIVCRCPVHKTLAAGVRIFDDVAFADATLERSITD